MTSSTITDNTAPALPLRRDWHEFHLPVHWSRLEPRPEGIHKPKFSDTPLDLSVPACVPDGQYPIANGHARSADHLATVKDGVLDLASTALACYEAVWRAHGLEPTLPWRRSEADPCHIFVEEIEFDHEDNVLRIWCGS